MSIWVELLLYLVFGSTGTVVAALGIFYTWLRWVDYSDREHLRHMGQCVSAAGSWRTAFDVPRSGDDAHAAGRDVPRSDETTGGGATA